MKPKLTVTWLFLFITLAMKSYGQHFTVTGNITDKSTGNPLEFVTVFIDKSTIGTNTNENGFFKLPNIPFGSKKLIVSSIGYKAYQTFFEADTIKTIHLNIALEPDNIALNEIKVSAKKDKQWEKDYKVFFNTFIGTSENAKKTVIKNPYILDFKHVKGSLIAKTNQLLIIENEALGYKISVVLDTFFHAYKSVSSVRSVFFEELPTKDTLQQKIRYKKREEVYLGSFRHFVNALLTNSLDESGFSVYEYSLGKNSLGKSITAPRDIIAKVKNSQLLYAFIFNGMLQINYKYNYSSKISWIKKRTDDLVVVDRYGNIFDNWFNFTLSGYWSNQALADDVPENFIRSHSK